MKKIILALLAVGALSAIAYYASQPSVSVAETAVTAAITASKPVASATPQVASPMVKPVVPVATPPPAPVVEVTPVAPAVAAAPQSTASQPGPSSPRTELATTIPELARLIDAQDFETLMQDFMPPDELTALLASVGPPGQPMTLESLASRMRQNPRIMQQMAGASQTMAYLQTQTPIYDATGENASYPRPPMFTNGPASINFVKVGGYWYVKDGVQFFK